MIETAMRYRDAGLCVLPAIRDQKRPALSGWKSYQSHLPTVNQLEHWFNNGNDACCVITGTVSGNLELMDFDFGGEQFDAWSELVPDELLSRLVIEQSQSGGRHVIYRCEQPISGNRNYLKPNGTAKSSR